MRISQPKITQKEQEIIYSVEVNYSQGNTVLYYSLNVEYADLVSSRSDAALVALLILAMIHGEDIHISGTISERLYYNLSGSYQKIIKTILPYLQLVNIHADDIQPASGNPSGVATGFSAGVDSYCVLADHYYKKDVAPGFGITHLLYNNVGSHGSGGESLFKQRYETLKAFVTEKIGLPFIAIDSNLNLLYEKVTFQHTHTPRNISVALLLQDGIKNYIYGSAYTYQDVFIGPKKDGYAIDMAYSDLVTLPLLSTETLNAFSAGSEYSRVDKILKVSQVEDSYKTLDVCVNNNVTENCSTCYKCMRTLLTLEIAGTINLYKNAFNLEVYYQHRDNYIAKHIINTNNPLNQEVVRFAKDKNFEFPSIKSISLKDKVNSKIKSVLKRNSNKNNIK
ncbi:MAG: hypothetical protein AAFX80_20990 [Cyanobacteria bacterium J06639_18]